MQCCECGTTQGFGLQTANKEEDEARWETRLRSLQFIAALRWCVEDMCEQHMSSLFICMVFATLEMHATTSWAAFQLQIRLASLQPRFGAHVMVYGLVDCYSHVLPCLGTVFSDMVRVLEDTSKPGSDLDRDPWYYKWPNFYFYFCLSFVFVQSLV